MNALLSTGNSHPFFGKQSAKLAAKYLSKHTGLKMCAEFTINFNKWGVILIKNKYNVTHNKLQIKYLFYIYSFIF